MKMPIAKPEEVYAVKEKIDFGNGPQEVIVIYPKNKLIPRPLREAALRKYNRSNKDETV